MDSIKDGVRSSVKVPEFDKHLKKAGGHIGRNVVEITIKMKTIVRKPFMIKILLSFLSFFFFFFFLTVIPIYFKKFSFDDCCIVVRKRYTVKKS